MNKDKKNDGERRRREAVRKFVWDYKSTHPCVDCGEADPIVLEFDHRDGSLKSFNVGAQMARAISVIKEEMDKCDVRCANCHRRKTYRDRKNGLLKGAAARAIETALRMKDLFDDD